MIDGDLPINNDDFEAAYGESLAATMDLNTWHPGGDLEQLYRRLDEEVHAAIATESSLRRTMREQVFPRLCQRNGAPPGAGHYRATVRDLGQVHHSLLFNGGVEACDGTSIGHDTLPVTITQIGICLTSYQGDRGSWSQRLFRRDLRNSSGDPLDDVFALLDNRLPENGASGEQRQRLSNFVRRGLMTYAERAILTHRATAPWRLGHGNPVSVEMLTGLGNMDLLIKGLDVLRSLILGHRKFVFVPSTPADRFILTIGEALHPLEYAVVDTAEGAISHIIDAGTYGYSRTLRREVENFRDEIGESLVRGVYRASPVAPPYLFYSHVEHVHEAALLVMADSILQEHRGFPMLIDLADRICQTTFGNDIFKAAVETAYISAGAPFRYLNERASRV